MSTETTAAVVGSRFVKVHSVNLYMGNKVNRVYRHHARLLRIMVLCNIRRGYYNLKEVL